MRVVKLLRFYSLALIFSLDNGKLNRTHLSICNLLILNPRIMPPLRGSIYFFSFSRGSASYEAPPPGSIEILWYIACVRCIIELTEKE